ncbi:enterochelin esterase [Reinekea thalattae]|uniref:Enterochelin esterase n=1 Tax=Reinekea thalattae TaxID=2593301 RepID=A0A5C8Z8U3_9GAMM|nr:enterochelin esterase [Reinekea thalattae]TXR53663.1 enterochelin esterase [Reinekea thalattae]
MRTLDIRECLNPENRIQPEQANLTALLILESFNETDIGSNNWWSAIKKTGTPVLFEIDSNWVDAIFLYQKKPEDNFENLYIHISGITNHHCFQLAEFEQFNQTDVWLFRCRLAKNWRASYQLLPRFSQQIREPLTGSQMEKQLQHRQFLIQLFESAIADPLNNNNLPHCPWGKKHSALSMPNAIPQTAWQTFDNQSYTQEQNNLTRHSWLSNQLQQERHYWLFNTSNTEDSKDLPLVILLDGDFWAETLPISGVVQQQTQQGHLPAAVYLFIDSIDGKQRMQDLMGSDDFWFAINNELIPDIASQLPITEKPEHTVVTGQSLGGLSALYAALKWPQRYGAVLSQSGSFWWPDNRLIFQQDSEKIALTDEMQQLLELGAQRPNKLNVFMEVGSAEEAMVPLNNAVFNALKQQQHSIDFRHFAGGHDRYCWRGGLIEGLTKLLNT